MGEGVYILPVALNRFSIYNNPSSHGQRKDIKAHVDQFGLQTWKRLIRNAKPADAGSVNATHRQQCRPQTEVGMVGDKCHTIVSGRPGVTSVRVAVGFWLCFDWQATCAVRCGSMHVRPQASFLKRLPCVFSLCILETIDSKHHVSFHYICGCLSNTSFVLQFLFPAQLVFLQLDKDASFSPPDKVDEVSILCSKDDPEIRREIRLKDIPHVQVSVWWRRCSYLDWVSPDLMRSLRMWTLLLPHQSDQLRIVSFSQRSVTIIRSPTSTSVVRRKETVVLLFRTGLPGEAEGQAGSRAFLAER